MKRTYSVKPHGKKFATICWTDGFWSNSWLSRSKRIAKRKGDEFVSGKRTSMSRYVTQFGEALNTDPILETKSAQVSDGEKRAGWK